MSAPVLACLLRAERLTPRPRSAAVYHGKLACVCLEYRRHQPRELDALDRDGAERATQCRHPCRDEAVYIVTRSMSTTPLVTPHARHGGHKEGSAKELVDLSQLTALKGELAAAPADRDALMLYTMGIGSHVYTTEWIQCTSYSCLKSHSVGAADRHRRSTSHHSSIAIVLSCPSPRAVCSCPLVCHCRSPCSREVLM
jgi:hypothetical protein